MPTLAHKPNPPRLLPDRGIVPVNYSLLSPDALLAEVTASYDIEQPINCWLLSSGVNSTYFITTRSHPVIGRVYRAGWRSHSEICYELELLQHLAAKGAPVSEPIACRDGRLALPLAAPEGPRLLALFTYAEGSPWLRTDPGQCYWIGRLVAALHAASDGFSSRHVRVAMDLAFLIDTPLATLRPVLARQAVDCARLEAFAGRVRAAAHAVAAQLDWGVCHGDLREGNIHVAGDGRLTVLDFDLCGPGWRAWDLIPIYRSAMHRGRTVPWHRFLQGYQEVRPLSVADRRALPLFRAISRVWGLGVAAQRMAVWGQWYASHQEFSRWLESLPAWEADLEEGR